MLTREKMKKMFPLWKQSPGGTYRDVDHLRLCCRWIDKGEYSATIFDTKANKFLFRENCDVKNYEQGMRLLDKEIKKYLPEQQEVRKV